MSAHQPGLKPFLETIDNWCRTLDRDGLLQLIMNLAKQVEPGKREEFLDDFPCLLPGKDGQTVTVAPAMTPVEQLLTEFADLREEINSECEESA